MTGDDTRRSEELRRLSAAVLAMLPGPDQPPVSTTDLGAALQLTAYERSARLWPVLDQLAKDGVVERVTRDGLNVRFWRHATTGGPTAQQPPGEHA